MKKLLNKFSQVKGFTLIELLVVIAILGVLAAVLIAVIDPVDKVQVSNDTGVIAQIAQLGKAMDAYSTNHNNAYSAATGTISGGNCTANNAVAYSATAAVDVSSGGNVIATKYFNGAVCDLNLAGEIKFTALTPPTGSKVYVFKYFANPTSCKDSVNDCANYAFTVPLFSKKYTGSNASGNFSYYLYANGKGCVLMDKPAYPTDWNTPVGTTTCP